MAAAADARSRRIDRALRKATDEILAKIRYLNQVAISMRAGLLDVEGEEPLGGSADDAEGTLACGL